MIAVLCIGVLQALESFVVRSQGERSQGFSNPFLEVGNAELTQLRTNLMASLQQAAMQPNGYAARLDHLDSNVIRLEVHQLSFANTQPPEERQRQTTYALCRHVVWIYERSNLDPSQYPTTIVLSFVPRLADLPTYQTTILFEDALAFWQGSLTQMDFEALWNHPL